MHYILGSSRFKTQYKHLFLSFPVFFLMFFDPHRSINPFCSSWRFFFFCNKLYSSLEKFFCNLNIFLRSVDENQWHLTFLQLEYRQCFREENLIQWKRNNYNIHIGTVAILKTYTIFRNHLPHDIHAVCIHRKILCIMHVTVTRSLLCILHS
jgi:hypothetical protein